MGLCPIPRKFFEKNLTKNFHYESFLWVYIVSSTEILRKRVRCNVIFVKCYDSLPLEVAKRRKGLRKQLSVVFPRA